MKEFIRVQDTIIAVNAIVSIELLSGARIFIRTTEAGYHFNYPTQKEMERDFEGLWSYLAD